MSLACVQCGVEVGEAKFCTVCGAPQPENRQSEEDPLVGTFVAGRYEIVELLSAGGMGKVYRGIQRPLDREVAVKFIHRELQNMEEVVERFMIEARSASSLNHPNVISIHDFGQTPPDEGGLLYMVMEFLSGRDLETVLQEDGPPPLDVVTDVLRQVLAALAEAHAQSVTHRDIKPENIVLTQKRGGGLHVKVIDFGIAKQTGRKLTQVGSVLGTPHYMAPEQGMGNAIDARADLYAVGVVMFEMLTGQVPFDADKPTDVLLKHMNEPRPDPREVAPDRGIPPALAEACLRAMSIDRNDRHASAEEFALDLERTAGEASRPASAPGPTEPPPDRASQPDAGDRVSHEVVRAASRQPKPAPLPRGEVGSGVGRTETLHAARRGDERISAVPQERARPSPRAASPANAGTVRKEAGPSSKASVRDDVRARLQPSREEPKPVAREQRSPPAPRARPKHAPKNVLMVVKNRVLADRLAKAFKSTGSAVTVCPLYSGARALIGPFDLGLFVFEDPEQFDVSVVRALLASDNVQRALFYGDVDDDTRPRLESLGPVLGSSVAINRVLAEAGAL